MLDQRGWQQLVVNPTRGGGGAGADVPVDSTSFHLDTLNRCAPRHTDTYWGYPVGIPKVYAELD